MKSKWGGSSVGVDSVSVMLTRRGKNGIQRYVMTWQKGVMGNGELLVITSGSRLIYWNDQMY